MAVTQYIGARYVPLFAEPSEWDSNREYEPLTIVTYQGNSYTSKQAVPRGIAISNEDFWAKTADYNAQVEQYRQEVRSFDTRISNNADGVEQNTQGITEVNAKVDQIEARQDGEIENIKSRTTSLENLKSLSYVGNHGAKEKDATVNWNQVIASVASVSDIIDFGAGTWYTNQRLVIPQSIKKVVGNCLIVAKRRLDVLVEISKRDHDLHYRPFTFDGITLEADMIDGVPCVNTMMYTLSNNTTITNCNFRNYRSYALYAGTLGLMVNGCQFMNQSYRGRAIAVHNKTDAFISNCRFFYNQMGVSIRQGMVKGCYFYAETGDEQGNLPSYGVGYISPSSENFARAINVNVSECEFDCINRVFRNINHATIDKCYLWWNGNNDRWKQRHAIFYNDDEAYEWALQDVVFSNNTLGIDKSLPLSDEQEIWMFDNIKMLENYCSYDCELYTVLDSNGQDNLCRFAVGVRNHALNSPRSYESDGDSSYVVTRIMPIDTTSATNQLYFDMPTFNATLRKRGTRPGGAYLGRIMPVANNVIKLVHSKNEDGNSDMWLTVPATGISKIIISGAPHVIENLKPYKGTSLENIIPSFQDYRYTFTVPATNS